MAKAVASREQAAAGGLVHDKEDVCAVPTQGFDRWQVPTVAWREYGLTGKLREPLLCGSPRLKYRRCHYGEVVGNRNQSAARRQ